MWSDFNDIYLKKQKLNSDTFYTQLEFLGLPDVYYLVFFVLCFQGMGKYLVCRDSFGKGRALHTGHGNVERIRRNLSCWLG